MTLTAVAPVPPPAPHTPRASTALLVGLVLSLLVALAGGVGRAELEAVCTGLASSAAPPPAPRASAGEDELEAPPALTLPPPGEGGR